MSNLQAMQQFRAPGVEVLHPGEVGLNGADDAPIFDWAQRDRRIIVTRNYQDFAPLLEHANPQGIHFPAVMFYARSLSQADVGGHVRALEAWISVASAARRNPADNTYVWIR